MLGNFKDNGRYGMIFVDETMPEPKSKWVVFSHPPTIPNDKDWDKYRLNPKNQTIEDTEIN